MKPKRFSKSWFLLTCLLLSTLSCFADTFVVTSNADSGPGTLREAITLANANGTTIVDYIHFNIADQSEAGRTISLASRLPSLTSSIVIDGSTQQGSLLGWSTAKVILHLNRFTEDPFIFLFIDNASDVAIYGMCFSFFGDPSSGGALNYGILMKQSSKIKIGAPGKGNVFYGVRWGIANNSNYFTDDVINDITIQSNVFGVLNPASIYKGSGTELFGYNITIGGDSINEGNRYVHSITILREPPAYNAALFVKFCNNISGLSLDGQQYLGAGGIVDIYGQVSTFRSSTKTIVSKNVIVSSGSLVVNIVNLKHKVFFTGNKLGTNLTGDKCLGYGNDFATQGCPDLTIGGHSEEDQNLMTGNLYKPMAGTHIIKNQIGGYIQETSFPPPDHPFCKINTYNNGLITGTANPNAKIQLYTNSCFESCVLKKYFATTYANAQGSWSFNYDISDPNIVATSTRADSSTSHFSRPKLDEAVNPIITNSSCGKSNGSVVGVKILEGTHFGWYNSNTGQLVSTDTNLVNVPAGHYYLRIKNGSNGCPLDKYVRIENIDPPAILNPPVRITQPSCGLNNGTIIANEYGNFYASAWFNSNMDTIGKNYFINNLFEGTYYLKVWIKSDTSCSKLFGPFILTNQSGPTLNLNNLQTTHATCGNNNGSITGISSSGNVTGTPYIAWVDSLNKIIGNTYDIINLKAGKYRFKFKDQGGCDTIITQFYTITNNGGISLDTSQLKVTTSQCSYASGTIKGIVATNATSYQWFNASGQVVSTSLDPGFLYPGKYILIAKNNFGCEKRTDSIVVPTYRYMTFTYTLRAEVRPGRCDQANGYVRFLNFANPQDYTFRWIDSAQPSVTLASTLNLSNIHYGTFILYAKNASGCEQQVATARLGYFPPPQLDEANLKVTDEICNNSLGGIEGIKMVNGKGTAPFSYKWFDNSNNLISSLQDLTGVTAGTYRLIVTDVLGCSDTSSLITITNATVALSKPVYANQTISINTSTTLSVQNQQQGNYYLYDDAQATVPLDQNKTGIFNTGILQSDKNYYIELINGSCKSERVKVIVKVYDKATIFVPTAFTPNNDGLNDFLNPIVTGQVKLEFFNIYNRWGQLVFSSSDTLSKGWDGTIKGVPQPSSSFSWTLKAKDEMTGKQIMMNGSFILIR